MLDAGRANGGTMTDESHRGDGHAPGGSIASRGDATPGGAAQDDGDAAGSGGGGGGGTRPAQHHTRPPIRGPAGRRRTRAQARHESGRLTEQLKSLLPHGVNRVEIDAARVTFTDSAGLRAVLWARTEAQVHGVDFEITAVSSKVERVIDLAGLRELLLRQ
jgi:anti-anti-sigma factor